MALNSPERIWWKPLGPHEKLWVALSVVFIVLLFLTMPLWQSMAKQQTPQTTYRVTPAQFKAVTEAFIAKYRVGELQYVPIVKPPPGDVYLMASQWAWSPVLELHKGVTYRLHLSSVDVDHGFSLQPVNMNFEVVPGYDQVLTLTPADVGTFSVVCNEYCGVGHQRMIGEIVVKDE